VAKKDLSIDPIKQRWFINLDWYQQKNRSFPALAQRCLCPGCREQLKGETEAADILTNIKDCCSKAPDFITSELPVLESIFRLFLANGNQPLNTEKLSKQLNERRGGDTCHTSPEILFRLLKNDRFYGIQPVKG